MRAMFVVHAIFAVVFGGLLLSSQAQVANAPVAKAREPLVKESGKPGQPSPQTPPPMEPFLRLIGGEWKMTAQSGTSIYRPFVWGPGRYSVRVMSDGEDAQGGPWRDLDVFYWDPSRKQVRQLGVSQVWRGISQGQVVIEADRMQADLELYQTRGRRFVRTVWTFSGPDRFHWALLEADAPGHRYAPLAEWDLTRTPPAAPPRSRVVPGATEPSELLAPCKPMLGTWDGELDGITVQATFEWIPLADAVYGVVLVGENRAHALDAYLYHHTGTGELRCLALSSRGTVWQGPATKLENGSLRLDLVALESDREHPQPLRLDFDAEGKLRLRAWATGRTEEQPALDAQFKSHSPTATK